MGMKISDSRYGRCMYFASNALARKTEKLAVAAWKKEDLSPSHAYLADDCTGRPRRATRRP